ncbi:MAG: MFS transporter [Synechococcaceae bacterium WB8_1A_041]|nr:MFS transporter [Synechococcaceae bacterium WB6_1B_055]NBP98159.1 MFS transporter [Synechococcaceae bacterium WB6_3A_227]NBR43810.1 MFS transporter [Synechococcaceae bacterium WB5_2B_268]NCU76250.1 MFS transporter [Synechococcaceae bacterium WB7_1C_051]NCY13786.1 MFS transporter [Synechococcaceae bacterium WB8_1A_041]NDA74610.1 MFS transporter [Synechococcaceae bacterium WB8_3_299]NDD20492.1 MFS transporter [Synechococcaceae bacterium WBA_3_309]NDE21434.1 MFS transporter [Synechococcaceae
MQWLVWSLATAGKFFEGLIVFMGGIALPLVSEQFSIDQTTKGFITAATLAGILIGALFLGGLADRFGRKPVFIGEMVLLLIGLLGASFSSSSELLIFWLFIMGLALGADYPTAHLVISESIPASIRGRLVLGAFSFQALGAVIGTAICAVVLSSEPELSTWRIFYLLPVIPVALVAWGRIFLPESSHWLLSKGHLTKAEKQLRKLLNRQDISLLELEIAEEGVVKYKSSKFGDLFHGKQLKSTILASLPWFLQDISTYGVGIFTPIIIAAAFGAEAHEHNLSAVIHNDLLGAKGTALIDIGFLVGISFAIWLSDKLGRIPLQIAGFIGCSLGLLIAAVGNFNGTNNIILIGVGFFLFQFMTNLGPNSQTYLIAGEVFPTKIRGVGAGFAAACGKVGAVLTAFFFPALLSGFGADRLLPLLALTSLIGALITWLYRVETKGVNLETI